MQNASLVYRVLRPIVDELRQLVAGVAAGAAASKTLLATLGFVYAGPSADLTAAPTLIAGTPPTFSTVGATKIIVMVSAKYTAASDAVTHEVTQQIMDAHGNVLDSVTFPVPEGDARVVTRPFEIDPIPAGDTVDFQAELWASIEASTPPSVTVSNVSFVLMAVAA